MLNRFSDLVRGGLGSWYGPHLRVEPYGSFVSGLFSPGGDLDISLEGELSQGYASVGLHTELCQPFGPGCVCGDVDLVLARLGPVLHEVGVCIGSASA